MLYNKKISFSITTILRLLALSFVLTIVCLSDHLRLSYVEFIKIYTLICIIYSLSLFSLLYKKFLTRLTFYMPIQIVLDIFLTSYLIFFSGINSSIFVSLYIINIVIATIGHRLLISISVYILISVIYVLIYWLSDVEMSSFNLASLIYHEFYFFLAQVLSVQLMVRIREDRKNIINSRRNYNHLKILTGKLIDNLPIGIMHIDEDNFVVSVNKAFLNIFNFKLILNEKILYHDLVPSLKDIRGEWFGLTNQERLNYIIKMPVKGKPVRDILLRIVEIRNKESIRKEEFHKRSECLFIFNDVSDLKKAERDLVSKSKLATVGQFAAGLAHEIRTPLASISGSIEVITNNAKSFDEDDKKLVSITLKEVKRLDKLIQEFLDYSKLSYEDINSDVSVYEVVSEVTAVMRNSKNKTLVNFYIDIPSDIKLKGSFERLKQVFFNLFSNSIEANKDRCVNIYISTRVDSEGRLHINVKDDGIGIPKDIANKIFDPFVTTKQKGSGLGLSSVEKIIRSFDGDISVIPTREGAFFELIFAEKQYKVEAKV